MSKGKTENRRHFRKEMLIPIVVILFFVIMFAVTCTGPKEVATAEQVWSAIEQAGYQPVDATELYREDMPSLVQCIAFEKDDEYFNFYVFKEQSNAEAFYAAAHSHIYINFYKYPNVEHISRQSNYCIYTLTASGRYSVDIYVGNTAVYAYCDEGNDQGIADVLYTIGYFD